MLSISEEQFDTFYTNTALYSRKDLFFTKPQSDAELIQKYLPSKLWRLNSLYTIIDKLGNMIKFKMNIAQHKVYSESLNHSRLIILKSRQQGISTLWLVSFFDNCIFRNNFNSGLMAQGEEEAKNLLLKTKLLWKELPDSIKKYLNIDIEANNTKEFRFTNNSAITISMSFRSSTLHGLHISEFGKIANKSPQRAEEVLTGSLQTINPKNTVIIESTAEGTNLYKNLWDNAIAYADQITPKDFKPIFLSWIEDPDCNLFQEQQINGENQVYFDSIEKDLQLKLTKSQKNFWIAQKRELGPYIHQEYPSTAKEAFLQNRDGTYYAGLYLELIKMRNREKTNLFSKALDVQVAIDLGRNDFFVLIFFQTYIDGWRIINSYKNCGLGIKHYCEVMDKFSVDLDYTITDIILPHDAVVRELTSDKTREEVFWEYGYENTIIVPKTSDINNDRELVREAMEHMYIDVKAQYVIDCFLNYSKEWDVKHNIWKDKHEHNEFSHGADALRYMVRGGIEYTEQSKKSNYAALHSAVETAL